MTTTLPATSCPVHITLRLRDDVGVVLVPLIRLILMMHQMIVVHQMNAKRNPFCGLNFIQCTCVRCPTQPFLEIMGSIHFFKE